MMENRLGELRLRIRSDVDDSPRLAIAAERIARSALERCAELMERKLPGRVVLLRHLPLKWRFDESLLHDESQVEVLAEAALDAIEDVVVASVSTAIAPDIPAIMFESEAHWKASFLLNQARGVEYWFHEGLKTSCCDEPLQVLSASDDRADAIATLVQLATHGSLVEVLASHGGQSIAALASFLGESLISVDATSDALGQIDPDAHLSLLKTAREWPRLERLAHVISVQVYAAILLEADFSSPGVRTLAQAVARELSESRTGTFDSSIAQTGASVLHLPKTSDRPDSARNAEIIPSSHLHTRLGGLFFLLDRLHELDIPDSLWKVCIPERLEIVNAMKALIGNDFADDPIFDLLMGEEPPNRVQPIRSESLHEISITTCTELVSALTRRGLAEVPDAELWLADHADGRLLMAFAGEPRFLLFAWDVPDHAGLDTGLGTFLSIWPHAAKACASAMLVGVDRSGRLRLRGNDSISTVPVIPNDQTLGWALHSIVMGAPCLLFSARMRCEAPSFDQFRKRYLEVDARVRIVEDRLDVRMNPGELSLELRQAGLDRDPGWVAWLGKSVRFELESTDLMAQLDKPHSTPGESP